MPNNSEQNTITFFGVSVESTHIDYAINNGIEPHTAGRSSPMRSGMYDIAYKAKKLGLKVYIMDSHSQQNNINILCKILEKKEIIYEVVPRWIGTPAYMAALHGYIYGSSKQTIKGENE